MFEVLLQREKLGTTAVGYGVAIPHGKLPKLEKISACSPGSIARSISRRWTVSLSTRLPAARPRRRRRRSSEGAGPHRPPAARPGHRQEAPRLARCAGDLLGAGAAAGDRGLTPRIIADRERSLNSLVPRIPSSRDRELSTLLASQSVIASGAKQSRSFRGKIPDCLVASSSR